jgi:hypothetical protein
MMVRASLSPDSLKGDDGPWLEALFGFAYVDEAGKVDALPDGAGPAEVPDSES